MLEVDTNKLPNWTYGSSVVLPTELNDKMPLHPDFKKILSNMIKKYGKKKGTSVFYAWIKKRGYDDTKPMPSSKERNYVNGLFLKEREGEFYTEGFVATDHIDNAHIIPIEEGGTGYPDYIPTSTLYDVAEQINGLSEANKVSLHHDRSSAVAGLSKSATVKPFGDGHYGVFVSTHNNKTHPDFENTVYEIENGMIDGYSIEFDPVKTHVDIRDGKEVRVLDKLKIYGYGYASRGVNPNASIINYGYKELISGIMETKAKQAKLGSGGRFAKIVASAKKWLRKKYPNLSDEQINTRARKIAAAHGIKRYGKKKMGKMAAAGKKEEIKMAEEEKVEEPTDKELEEADKEVKKEEEKPEEKVEEKPEEEEKKVEIDEKEYQKYLKLKEMEKKEEEEKKLKIMVKEQLKGLMPENFPLNNTEEDVEKKEIEVKEVKEYKEAVSKNAPIDVQYAAAARLINKEIEISKQIGRPDIIARSQLAPSTERRYIQDKEEQNWTVGYTSTGKLSVKEGEKWSSKSPQAPYANKLQTKELSFKANTGLETDTNKYTSWTYGSYYVLPAELNDIFQPIVINQLNESQNIWNTLQKVDFSNYAAIQFRIRYKRNATAGGQAESYDPYAGAAYTGYQGRAKMTQPFAYYYVYIQVSGPEQALAQAPGGIGDVYADEVKFATLDLTRDLELDIIGTGQGTSESALLGFEALIDYTNYTSLYGHTRTTYDAGASEHPRYPLRSAGADDASSARITLKRMRDMITAVVDNGANQSDLAFYGRRLQQDFIRALIQDMQRIVPTSTRVGFEGKPELDGVPVFDCINMNTDDLFLIDTAHTKIGVKVAPTYEETAKIMDARNGFIKFYGNLYSDAPSHNYWTYGLATS